MEQQTSLYLDAENYLSYMTDFARYIASLIGIPATVILLERYAGRSISISSSPKADSQKKLALDIGSEAAFIIGKLSNRQPITIPICRSLLRAKRDDDIRLEFDRLTAKEKLSARAAVQRLTQHTNPPVHERTIWRALKKVN